MTSLREQFLSEVETFLVERSLDATTLGRLALNDPAFVFDLRQGRNCSARTIDRVRAYMAGARQAA